MPKLIAVLFLFAASAGLADPVTMGSYPIAPGFGLGGTFTSAAVTSIIDVAHPATANGTVDHASIYFSGPCSAAFKLAFLRPIIVTQGTLPAATRFTVTDVRGPFDAVGQTEIVLTPAVQVRTGDLLALVTLQPGITCGGVIFEQRPRGDSAAWLSTNDVSVNGTLAADAGLKTTEAFAMIAYSGDPLLVRVLPVAGAVQGAGAFFRTSVQLFKYGQETIKGKLVFHPAGAVGSDSDPSLPFTIGSSQTLSFPDVVAAMGTSGIGSLDVVTYCGADVIVSARVFSDGGSAGTSGFIEEGLEPELARRPSLSGIMLLPADLTNFRMNVGIRTLESGAVLNIITHDAGGVTLNTRGVTYSANYFDQPTLSQFTGLTPPPEGGSVQVQVTSGAAFIYGSIIDNRTQDSSMRMVEFR